MSALPKLHSDPLIDEVRQRRRELLARYGNDLSRLGEALQKRQTEHPMQVTDRRKHATDAHRQHH